MDPAASTPVMAESNALGSNERSFDTIEFERRAHIWRDIARWTSIFIALGALMVFIVWLVQPQYTQFLVYAFIILPSGIIAFLRPLFEKRHRLTLWSSLFIGSGLLFAFAAPLLVPDAILAMAICYILMFQMGGLLLGSKSIPWIAAFSVPALVTNIIIGHSVEERWFVTLDPQVGAIIAPVLGAFLLVGSAIIVYLILRGQENLYHQAQQARAAAEDANTAKSRMLARVSHELRTPLSSVLGYAELLRDGSFGRVNEEQKQVAEDILNNAAYLGTMVSELLDEARMETSTIVLQPTAFAPTELLRQATSGLILQARNYGLEFTTFVSPDLPTQILGDEHRLKQVLLNLAGNAIKFTKKGEVRVSFLPYPGGKWMIQVTDTGIGIPEEARKDIFEPFRQVENIRPNGSRGIGLGLSITHQLVNLMGGEIRLESELGRGSTFSVILPLES